MKKIFYFLVFMTTFSCKKDNLNIEIYNEAINNVVLDCNGQYLDKQSYFYAKINNIDDCYAEGEDGYHLSVQKWVTFITSESYIEWDPNSPGKGKYFVTISIKPDNYSNFKEYIELRTPLYDSSFTTNQILQQSLHSGDLSFVKTSEKDESIFNFSLIIPVTSIGSSNGAYLVGLKSGHINDKYNKLVIKDLKITKTSLEVNYDMLFNIQCNLYSLNDPFSFYGTLSDGVLRVKFSLPIEE